MIVTPMSALFDVGIFWEREMGGKWGGKPDPIHFEYPNWRQKPPAAAEKARRPTWGEILEEFTFKSAKDEVKCFPRGGRFPVVCP